MSSCDPMLFAAQVGNLSDNDLFRAFNQFHADQPLTEFQQAVLDEAQMRGILTASEAKVIGSSATASFPIHSSR